MTKQMVIAVGREYGSGGHEIAERIAAHYGIPLYDRALIDAVADDSMIAPGVVAMYDEKPLSLLFRPVPGDASVLSMEQQVALQTFSFLNRKATAELESFVVVGRCAEAFLAGNPALTSIFVLGDEETKAQRVMEKYSLSHEDALRKMRRADKLRRSYHNFYCERKWGDSRTYDLCVNSSRMGVEATAEALIRLLDVRYRD